MPKRDLLKFPDDLEGNIKALFAVGPAPAGTTGSRKAPPKPPAKPKKKAKRRPTGPKAPVGTYAYEDAPVHVRAKKKAAKKR